MPATEPSIRRIRRIRRIRALAACAVAASTVLVALDPAVEASPCWRPPVEAPVVDPFLAPPCAWCAGNRGLDYRVAGSADVRAAAPGRVVFVGVVVDVRYVVVQLANGWRHTYGQLTSTGLEPGDVVLAGAGVGRVTDRFFFGLRIGDEYADPAPYLGEVVGRRRLVPVDDTPPRPAPPSIRCQVGDARR